MAENTSSGFDEDFVKQLTRDIPPGRGRGWRKWLLASLVVTFLAGAASLVARFRLRDNDDAALAEMAIGLLVPLSENRLEAALAVCAAGGRGGPSPSREILGATETQNKAPQNSATGLDAPAAARLRDLANLRAEMAAAGVHWSDITPLAFGGVRADVFEPDSMTKPAVAVIGEIFFVSRGRVYAIEASARRVRDAYVLVELWQWARTELRADQVERYAAKRFLDFMREPAQSADGIELQRPQHVFVRLDRPR